MNWDYIFVYSLFFTSFFICMDYCLHSVHNILITTGENILNSKDYYSTNFLYVHILKSNYIIIICILY